MRRSTSGTDCRRWHHQGQVPRRIIAVIPAKNERDRIDGALFALERAAAVIPVPVVALVLANNCTDDTVAVARAAGARMRHCALDVQAAVLPSHLAHAGAARRAAVDCGMERFAATVEDVIVSTDADARLRPDALSSMCMAFAGGDDLVLAKIECIPDPLDPVPPEALAWGSVGVAWRHCVRRFVETVRKGRRAPSGLHDDYGGAGIAVRVGAYRDLGGFLPIPANEDLELVRSADRAHMRVNRHSGAVVDVLARSVGRAHGGMATALGEYLAAARRRLPCLVEHHAVTIARIVRNPCHANAFANAITEWEPAAEAIAGLERAASAYGEQP